MCLGILYGRAAMTNTHHLDAMATAYVECALWSSYDQSTESGGYPLDDNYDAGDIAPASLESMRQDCLDFLQGIEPTDLAAYIEAQGWEQLGHDFWLTRNHHGAGFWDRGLGSLGDRLTEAADAYGSSDLYVGDDGKVYAA